MTPYHTLSYLTRQINVLKKLGQVEHQKSCLLGNMLSLGEYDEVIFQFQNPGTIN